MSLKQILSMNKCCAFLSVDH